MTAPRVGGLVLAAGEGRRFGGPKALATLDGERLVDRAVTTLVDGGCEPVLVVEGAARLGIVPCATTVHAAAWREGMGASLRTGLRALPDDLDACVVMLVDTPWLTPDAVRAVVDAFRGATVETGAVVATYDGTRGHPVLFARRVWHDVAASLTGDEGARAWLRTHPDLVVELPCDGLADPTDVDEPVPGVVTP